VKKSECSPANRIAGGPFFTEITEMWLYCPRCNAQTNAKNRSLYGVFKCGKCNHRFRGIHAKPNKLWHGLVVIVNPAVGRPTETWCLFCGSTVEGSDSGWWPSVCASCARDLPTDHPSQPAAVVSQDSGEAALPSPSSPQPDWDGCGPCKSCGFIYQMMFANAVCPRCSVKMTREDAFFSCGSYPNSTPPESQ
jgi:ribosomal protein L37AE/L43A